MTPFVSLPWKLSCLQSPSVKNKISLFSTPPTEGPAWNRHSYHIVLTPIIGLTGANGPWSIQKLGISVEIKTGPVAKVLSWQKIQVSFCFILDGQKYMSPTDETKLSLLNFPVSFVKKKAKGTLPGKGALFTFTGNIALGNAKSTMKHSAVCKPLNKQPNGKEGKGK